MQNLRLDKCVRSGFVAGVQHYKCKDFNYNYINADKLKKYRDQDHLRVLKFYLENCDISTIERVTGIRNSQISKISEAIDNIIKKLLCYQNSIKSIEDITILKVDELCRI